MMTRITFVFFFFSSRRRHTRCSRDWSSDVCSSDLVSRAAGETAPILFCGAVFYRGPLPKSVFDQSMSLSYHLYSISTQGGQVPESVQFGTAVVLLGLVLCLNFTAIAFRIYFRSRKKW